MYFPLIRRSLQLLQPFSYNLSAGERERSFAEVAEQLERPVFPLINPRISVAGLFRLSWSKVGTKVVLGG